MQDERPVRLGVLGCAAVTDYAVLASAGPDRAIEVVAAASRDADRAAAWAAERGIPQSYGSYEALLAEADVDAIYIPLPNGMHHEWAIRTLRAGFPLLCEKPIAVNAAQAEEIAAVAAETGLPAMEAVHWKFHPSAARMKALTSDRALFGELRRIEVNFVIPHFYVPSENIRHSYALGGGALLDQGCYCVSMSRFIAGGEIEEVVSAEMIESSPEIEGIVRTTLLFPRGIEARITCTMMDEGDKLTANARFIGSKAMLSVHDPFLNPAGGLPLTLETAGATHVEHSVAATTYDFQAEAFAAIVRAGQPTPELSADWVANMRTIDAIYDKAGMRRRGLA